DDRVVDRLYVGGAGVSLRRRTPGDVLLDYYQRRRVARLLEDAERPVEHLQVVGVADARDVPAQAHELGGDVLAEGEVRVPLDGDPVAVVDPAQVGQLPVAGEGCGLGGAALRDSGLAA